MISRRIGLPAALLPAALATLMGLGAIGSNVSASEESALPVLPAVRVVPETRHVWDIRPSDHPSVQQWVRRFQTQRSSWMARTLERGRAYRPLILSTLESEGLPREFFYLALIESEFNPSARSRVGARGLWQFMAGTARGYGLRVDRGADERLSPEKSTRAAARHLVDLHNIFDSWYLAAAAYNCGAGCVMDALEKVPEARLGDDASFFLIREHLPAETRAYVPKFLAAAAVGKDTADAPPAPVPALALAHQRRIAE